jgi:hypothetical protein
MNIVEQSKLRGNLSYDIFGCEFFMWWASLRQTMNENIYFLSPKRTDSRDKIIEAYLRSKGLGNNGVAMVLASTVAFQWLSNVNEDTTLREFLEMAKSMTNPLAMVLEILIHANVPVKPLSEKITEEHLNDSEEGIKILVRLKQGGKRVKMGFEGRYDCTEEGHDKFWEVTYVGGEKPFRASWGPRRFFPKAQGHKDYTEAEVRDLVRKKTMQGGYSKA